MELSNLLSISIIHEYGSFKMYAYYIIAESPELFSKAELSEAIAAIDILEGKGRTIMHHCAGSSRESALERLLKIAG